MLHVGTQHILFLHWRCLGIREHGSAHGLLKTWTEPVQRKFHWISMLGFIDSPEVSKKASA